MSFNLLEHSSFKKLDKILLWPLISFSVLIILAEISITALYYLDYIPNVLSLLEDTSIQSGVLDSVRELVSKIMLRFSTAMLLLFMVSVFLIYVVWHVNKLAEVIKSNT